MKAVSVIIEKVLSCGGDRKKRAMAVLDWSALPYFFANESLLHVYFTDGRNNVAFFIGKIRLQAPTKRLVFSYCSRIWKLQSVSSNNQKNLPSLPPNIFFTSQIQDGHVTSRNKQKVVKRSAKFIFVFIFITSIFGVLKKAFEKYLERNDVTKTRPGC